MKRLVLPILACILGAPLASAQTYESAFAGYKAYAEPAVADWKATNVAIASSANPHAGHDMSKHTPAKPDPHAGHDMSKYTPAKPDPHAGHDMSKHTPAKPDPHAGHNMAKPAKPIAPLKSPSSPTPKADPHAGHDMSKPATSTPDPHAGHQH